MKGFPKPRRGRSLHKHLQETPGPSIGHNTASQDAYHRPTSGSHPGFCLALPTADERYRHSMIKHQGGLDYDN